MAIPYDNMSIGIHLYTLYTYNIQVIKIMDGILNADD
jgi:hypothetical protein